MAVVAGLARSMYRAALPGFIKAGLSQRRTFAAMKLMGIPTFRRQDMVNMFRQMSGISKMEKVIKFVRKGFLPSKDIMATSATTLKRNYLTVVKLNVYDDKGKFIEEKYTSLMHDDRMSVKDLEAEALANMEVGVYVEKDVNYADPIISGAFKDARVK